MHVQKFQSTKRHGMPRGMLATLAALLLMVQALFAGQAMVRQFNLGGLVSHADKIFRGTVLGVSRGTITVGGGTLDTVTFKLEVKESFKGSFSQKGDQRYTEVTMVTKTKSPATVGTYRAFSALPEAPRLRVGRDYLLMTTAPSAIGLSTTVGLGQGWFEIAGAGKSETATNAARNRGLVAGSKGGPMNYSELVSRIRAELGAKGGSVR